MANAPDAVGHLPRLVKAEPKDGNEQDTGGDGHSARIAPAREPEHARSQQSDRGELEFYGLSQEAGDDHA